MSNTNKSTYGIVYLLIAALAIGGFFYLTNKIYDLQGRNDIINSIDTAVANNGETKSYASFMALTYKDGWLWENTSYSDENHLSPKNGKVFNLILKEDGTFTTTTDCNGGAGLYSLNGSKISFSDITRTELYCEGSQEGIYFADLEKAESYFVTSSGLLGLNLKDNAGQMIFVLNYQE